MPLKVFAVIARIFMAMSFDASRRGKRPPDGSKRTRGRNGQTPIALFDPPIAEPL
jgi:hypothetical protein